ncbi:MAG: pyridoxine 5'-phosphate synthase [Betaproteobacteria bacterium AqS2]|uniref:Pyridoxine 5'-phosphate synthase n=1 Tax=Candidatus Amphirhobacter heronislandensis TaxID=1732024 RepID=A0A930UE08_9GAMM|nr:pyridoxine 5'-phosphate synthase [Betaproteobacteria bacterium AqS2]
MTAPLLGVNIDHAATLRQVRHAAYPAIKEVVEAAEAGGADFITAHLREDRRHIQDADVPAIMAASGTWLNLEIAAVPAMVEAACGWQPKSVCLVPERREELTTEGGLDVKGAAAAPAQAAAAALRAAGIEVSVFVDPDPEQIDAAAGAGADAVEIHTGAYANAANEEAAAREYALVAAAAAHGRAKGLTVNVGHGLTLANVGRLRQLDFIVEYNIGHSIICDALFCGLPQAVGRMRKALGL